MFQSCSFTHLLHSKQRRQSLSQHHCLFWCHDTPWNNGVSQNIVPSKSDFESLLLCIYSFVSQPFAAFRECGATERHGPLSVLLVCQRKEVSSFGSLSCLFSSLGSLCHSEISLPLRAVDSSPHASLISNYLSFLETDTALRQLCCPDELHTSPSSL